ncbi:MAG: hypothetical protein JXR94_10980 [Candidatus Hydrogenedentes bacterium]|nr:hypothetical protein [Candidatus Hydrogenedentota bacterium]
MAFLTRQKFAFENYGGSYQLRIQSAADLAALEELDDPFWMATSAPLSQLTCDPVLLDRLDRLRNQRLQSCEVRRAARWLLHVLADRRRADERSDVLELAAIDTSHDEGRQLRDTARRVLRNLGHDGEGTLSLAQARDHQAIFAQGLANGDGVIPADGQLDAELDAFIQDIIATEGSTTDLNGALGVDQALVDAFLANSRALIDWHDAVRAEGGEELLPFGADTAARYELYARLAPAIRAYFRQCDVVELNRSLGRAAARAECPAEVFDNESAAADYLARAPLAAPRADGLLRIEEGVNPHYRAAVAELATTVIAPALKGGFNGEQLDERQWRAVEHTFAPYEGWLAAKAGGQVETLGLDKLRGYLDSDLPARLQSLIESDLAVGKELSVLKDLEFLILLQRWFLDICNNFVSFAYLYDPRRRAMFETGRVVMDGHVFNMNFRVTDVAAHSARAERAGIYLLYSEVTGGPEDAPFYIVTPVTTGRLANLGPGKRGVLFDASGRQWETRVVKVVENPVNLREAIAAPFKRIGAQISATAERITSGAEKQLETQIAEASSGIEAGVKGGIAASATAPAPPPAPEPGASAPGGRVGGLRDMLLSGGVAVAALGSSFAFIGKTLSEMGSKWWLVLVAVAVGLTLVVIPTALIASLRLRRRNLSGVLEASDWAINAPMRLTRNLRRLIVQRPPHPTSIAKLRRDLTRSLGRAFRLNR